MPDSPGESVSEADLRWVAAAEELTPAKSLARATESAKFLVGAVSGIGVLLTVFGAVTATQLEQSPVVLVFLAITVALSSASVAVALWALLTRTRSVRPGNLVEVRAWFEDEIKRKGKALLAGWLLIGGVVAALIAGCGAIWVERTSPPDCSVSLSSTQSQVGYTVKADLSFERLREGVTWHAEAKVRNSVVSSATGSAGAAGSQNATLEWTVKARPSNVELQVRADDGGGSTELCRASIQ